MEKLGYQSKGDFQRANFVSLAQKYFEGGNAQGRNASIAGDLAGIIRGLSTAWDEAEEHSSRE